jgi:hypothetical protein
MRILCLGGQRRGAGGGKSGNEGKTGGDVREVFHGVPLGCHCDVVWEQPNGGGLFRKEQNRIKCKRL